MMSQLSPFFSEMENDLQSLAERLERSTHGGGDLIPFNCAVDVAESDEEYTISADVPGLKKEDIKVQVEQNNTLVLSGERSTEETTEEDTMRRRERTVGRFERRFKLPQGTEKESIEAEITNGVLKLRIPKSKEKEGNAFDVSIAGE
jgi:HSP20 family protein